MNAIRIESLDELLEELRQGYLASIPQKIEQIRSRKECEEFAVQGDFHRLKGSGASYGVPEISQLGEIMVQICREKPKALSWVLPLSIELLEKIRVARLHNHPFQIQAEERYHEILLALTSVK